MIDIGSLYDKKGSTSPLLYCARHLAYHFLLTERKGHLKSDRVVRVSVKSLALNCLAHVVSLEPLIWNSHLSESGVTNFDTDVNRGANFICYFSC